MSPEEKEQDVIFMLERKCEILQLKLTRKTLAANQLKRKLSDGAIHNGNKVLEQKETIDRLSAELGKMARKMKRLSNK